MCNNFEPQIQTTLDEFGFKPTDPYPVETFPLYRAPFVRAEAGDAPLRTDLARFGLVCSKYGDRSKIAAVRNTQNARAETVDALWSYERAWKHSQFGLVPMERFFEPYYGSDGKDKKSVRWEIRRQDKHPFTIAAIWDEWKDRDTGELLLSFSMVTVNATGHPIMGQFHKAEDEKRSLVIIPREQQLAWLTATPEVARAMLLPMPTEQFTSAPAPLPARRK